jgi:iron complex outermembrane receptor protein
LGENNKYDYFPSVGIAYKVVENKDGIVILKLETLVKQVTKFSPNSAISRGSYGLNGTLNVDSNANDLK